MTIFNYAKRTTGKVTAWRAGRYDYISPQKAIGRSTGLRAYGYQMVRAMRVRVGMYDHVVQPKVSKGHAIQKKIERVEHNTCRW